MKKYLFILLLFSLGRVFSQTTIPLYEGTVPNDNPDYKGPLSRVATYKRNGKDTTVTIPIKYAPTLTIYQPSKAQSNGKAILDIPGGAYRGIAMAGEGTATALRFLKEGYTVFVLYYRIPNAELQLNKEIVPLQDAQRALQFVRENAKTYAVDPNKIGVIGFSAGGHLASTLGTHFNDVKIDNPKNTSLRPDYLALIYPVISFKDSLTHLISREALIGPELKPEKIVEYSNELQVTPQTPPTFIVHSIDDAIVKVSNALVYVAACQQNNVPVEFFIYEKGVHGYNVNNPKSKEQWVDAYLKWAKKVGF